jgi:hypothetical protein
LTFVIGSDTYVFLNSNNETRRNARERKEKTQKRRKYETNWGFDLVRVKLVYICTAKNAKRQMHHSSPFSYIISNS